MAIMTYNAYRLFLAFAFFSICHSLIIIFNEGQRLLKIRLTSYYFLGHMYQNALTMQK